MILSVLVKDGRKSSFLRCVVSGVRSAEYVVSRRQEGKLSVLFLLGFVAWLLGSYARQEARLLLRPANFLQVKECEARERRELGRMSRKIRVRMSEMKGKGVTCHVIMIHTGFVRD